MRNVAEGVGGALACAAWLWGAAAAASRRHSLFLFVPAATAAGGHAVGRGGSDAIRAGMEIVGMGIGSATITIKDVGWLAAAGGTIGLLVYLCQAARSKLCKLS